MGCGEADDGAARLDRLIDELDVIIQQRSFDRCLRAGRLVIDGLYGGDLGLWRRKTTKTLAFRQLAKHPRLPLSAAELYRCVATYEVVTRLETVARWPNLTISHIRTVIGLEPTRQEDLLERAHARRWSVLRLAREASGERQVGRENRGRPAVPRLVKILTELHRLVDDPHQARGLTELIDEMEPNRLDELRCAIDSVHGLCADLLRLIPT